MCPNCVTPWKCNGPHLSEQTVSAQPAAGEGLREPIDVPISAADHPEHYRGGFRAGYRAALAAQPTAGEGLLRELDNLKPLYNANGPGVDRGKTFSGWEVPDWLMQRIRAALQPASEAPRGRLVELDVSTGKTTPLQPASEGDDQC